MRPAREWHIRCTNGLLSVSRALQLLWPALPCALAALCLCACATIPNRRYGIDDLRFRGVKELDKDALRACLATEQREKLTLGLGALISPECGVPPFDRSRWSGRMFALPWKDWPSYDEALLKLDLDRIERWYQARGFYGVRVLDVTFDPPAARSTDACQGEDCSLDIEIKIEEGKPVHIRKLAIQFEGQVTAELRERVERALELEKGDLFDEALYDQARSELARVLREEGYARAQVVGGVVVNRGLLVADLTFTVTPGPACHMGEIRVVSKSEIPEGPVLAAALLRSGQPYRESELEDAQRAIYALGAFGTVTVRGELEHTEGAEIPIVIELEPRRRSQVQVGAGILSGIAPSAYAAEQGISIPQWDVHLLGSYEHRNFFGGLRRFRVEERPRMLFLSYFPSVPDVPRFGNVITASFSQPGITDPRTRLYVDTRWDYGPDPFLLFFRNDVGLAIGLERGFFRQRLIAALAAHQELMEVSPMNRQPITHKVQTQLEEDWTPDPMANPPRTGLMTGAIVTDRQADLYYPPSSYRLPFLEQRVSLDLRDDATRPNKGGYFLMSAHEAVRIWEPSWNYLRLTPEVRGYAPLGLGIVLAARFALGWLKVFKASSELDPLSRALGDGRTGGTHRWEASLELRVPLSKSFSIVGFADMGDVNAGIDVTRIYAGLDRPTGHRLDVSYMKGDQGFRFDHLNTAVGGGLRYYTIIGPIRLDVGVRPKQLGGAEVHDKKLDASDKATRQFSGFRGAIHLTIGESF